MPEPQLLTAPPAAETRPVPGILGLGTALPPHAVKSAEVEARIGVGPGWIERRTGISSRRRLADGESLTDLAVQAARAALADAGTAGSELGLVLVATCTADHITPGAAPLVAHAVGSRAAGVDVNAACTGFLAGLDLACSAVESGRAERVLLVGADALSRFTDHDDRRTAGIFGDGAGAVIVGEGGGSLAPVVLRSAGEHARLIEARRDDGVIRMEGHETFLVATSALIEASIAACRAAEIGLDDVDLFVFHQANRRILASVADRLGVDRERVVDSIGDHGNTSAASIPLALAEARDAGRLGRGDRVLLGAMGAGFVYGAGVLTW